MKRHRMGFVGRRTSPPTRYILMISFVLFILITYFSLEFIDEKITPTIVEIAEVKVDEFATRGINSAVKFAEEYTFDDVAYLEKTEEGNISGVGWDASVVNKINRAATDRVEEFFHSMNRGTPPQYSDPLGEPDVYGDTVDELVDRDPTVIEIPIGQATGNSILANLGPRIPVNLELVGAVRTQLIEEIEQLPINNVFVSVYVHVEADVQVVVPFTSKVTTVDTKILIDKNLVMGVVPEFYSGNGGDPSIAIPKEDLQDE
ncbi:sporulation protein YunB [Ornithinibacillus californiensis]|uniref:sporulation protein YunB n=1 Tax=Ornithinibacillus californiensis TaxID=161536 RepID=UPI00064D8365|nr:sporulation protein YunB [Ornithinibacillus californiensis]